MNAREEAAAALARGDGARDREAWDEALEHYTRAVTLAPDEPEYRLVLADALQDEGSTASLEAAVAHASSGVRAARAAGDRELAYELLVCEAEARDVLGEAARALALLDEAVALWTEGFAARAEKSRVLFERLRFEESEAEATVLVQRWPDEPAPHHLIGLLRERQGRIEEARRSFARATALDPERFPAALALDEGEFDAVVQEALRTLPAPARAALDHNVTVSVEPLPSVDDLRAEEPPLSPTSLGLFRGTPLSGRSVSNAGDFDTAAVVLFQRNLERFARDRAHLLEEVRITLVHELGHLLGLSEEELAERGLE